METELPAQPPTLDSSLDLDMLDTLEQQERPKPRERVANGLTYTLLALFGVVGSFAAGAWYQREHGDKPNVTATAGPNANAPGANVGTAGAANPGSRGGIGTNPGSAPTGSIPAVGAGGFAGGGTVGQIKLVDGNNVYITDAQGNTIKVVTQPGLAVNVTKAGTVADLKAGDTIIVTGETNADGFINATAIRSGGQAGGVAPGQGGQGQGGARGGGAPTASATSR